LEAAQLPEKQRQSGAAMGKGDSNNLPLSFRQFLYGKPIDFRLGQLNAEAFNRLDCPLPVFPFSAFFSLAKKTPTTRRLGAIS